jgi:hypothetical protein
MRPQRVHTMRGPNHGTGHLVGIAVNVESFSIPTPPAIRTGGLPIGSRAWRETASNFCPAIQGDQTESRPERSAQAQIGPQ